MSGEFLDEVARSGWGGDLTAAVCGLANGRNVSDSFGLARESGGEPREELTGWGGVAADTAGVSASLDSKTFLILYDDPNFEAYRLRY